MYRLITILFLVSVAACSGSSEEALEGAISAANENDLEGFLEHMDEGTREFLRVGLSDEERLPSDWVVLQGDPLAILRGAVPQQYIDLGGGVVRATVEKDDEERIVWILKTGGGFSSGWKIHLLSRDHLLAAMRMQPE